MALVWAHCKGKMICEADETKDEDGVAAVPAKVGHGGLKLFLVYQKGRADDGEPETRASQPGEGLYPALDVYNPLKKIPDSDLALLGLSGDFARPDWMIHMVLLCRHHLFDQVSLQTWNTSINIRRCEEEGSPVYVISEFEQLLKFHVANIMDYNITSTPRRSSIPSLTVIIGA
ncbi:DNA-directed RNA polymerase II subunit rpb1 [Ceratobasidium sp. 394]|nr:DNA-directed RNA polymerase II subunit rpb1 [Ceratobasidium sp. 394]